MSQEKSVGTVVDEGAELRGSLSANGPVLVRGRLDGEVSGPALEISETGVLTGKAKVTQLRSLGEIGGTFDADAVELAGTVRDKTVIRAQSLQVGGTDGQGTATFGDCELVIGDPPVKEEAIAQATGASRARPATPAPALSGASA